MEFGGHVTQAGSVRPTKRGVRSKCSLAWGSRLGEEATQGLGAGGKIARSPSWILRGLQVYLLEHFAQIKPPCPLPGALSQNPLALPHLSAPHSHALPGHAEQMPI